MASLDVIEADLKNFREKYDSDKVLIWGELKKIESSCQSLVDNKVSYGEFWSVVGILFVVLSSVLGFMIWMIHEVSVKVEDTNKTVVMTQIDVSALKTKLGGYDIKYEK